MNINLCNPIVRLRSAFDYYGFSWTEIIKIHIHVIYLFGCHAKKKIDISTKYILFFEKKIDIIIKFSPFKIFNSSKLFWILMIIIRKC